MIVAQIRDHDNEAMQALAESIRELTQAKLDLAAADLVAESLRPVPDVGAELTPWHQFNGDWGPDYEMLDHT